MSAEIVVPLDGSENAEQSLPYAAALARQSGGSIVLVSVVDIPVEFGAWSVGSAGLYGSEIEKWQLELEEYLARKGSEIVGVDVTSVVRIGSAAIEISEVVKGLANPLIVTTSHGRTGAKRLFMGSVASNIVHESTCPVLIIRILDRPVKAVETIQDVVVPLDGSDFAEHGLATVTKLFGSNLNLHLVRVIETPAFPASGVADGGMAINYQIMDEYMDAMRNSAADYLKGVAAELQASSHTVTAEVREGLVADEVQQVADKHDAQLIAMATHGRGGLGRMFLGSVAERVLQHTAVPLLLTKPPKDT